MNFIEPLWMGGWWSWRELKNPVALAPELNQINDLRTFFSSTVCNSAMRLENVAPRKRSPEWHCEASCISWKRKTRQGQRVVWGCGSGWRFADAGSIPHRSIEPKNDVGRNFLPTFSLHSPYMFLTLPTCFPTCFCFFICFIEYFRSNDVGKHVGNVGTMQGSFTLPTFGKPRIY